MLTLVPGGMDADAARTDARVGLQLHRNTRARRAGGRGILPAAPNFELPLHLSSAPGDGSTQVFKFTHTAQAAGAGAPPRPRAGPRAPRPRARATLHTAVTTHKERRGEGECSVSFEFVYRLKDHAGCRSIRAEYDLYGDACACV